MRSYDKKNQLQNLFSMSFNNKVAFTRKYTVTQLCRYHLSMKLV